MAVVVSGFEGYEKRLELHFSGDDPVVLQMGLRQLEFDSLQQVLHEVQCTIVSAVGNHYFDSYVLSESSLFVYPTKIIIKTCGTTQLLKSIRPFYLYARDLGLTLSSCRYTRGSFIFPKSQPFPHSSFREEVVYIEESLPNHLCYRKASVMPSKLSSLSWHVFAASHEPSPPMSSDDDLYIVEVCMTDLDRHLLNFDSSASFQFLSSGNLLLTDRSGTTIWESTNGPWKPLKFSPIIEHSMTRMSLLPPITMTTLLSAIYRLKVAHSSPISKLFTYVSYPPPSTSEIEWVFNMGIQQPCFSKAANYSTMAVLAPLQPD